MVETWRAYTQMASGLGELTAARAREVARGLLSGGVPGVPFGAPQMAGSVAAVAEDLLSAARANRGLLVEVVRAEVDRAVAGLGLVTAAEMTSLRQRVRDLERDVESLHASSRGRTTGQTTARKTPARKTTARKTTAGKTTARKTAAKKSTAKKSTAETTTGGA